MLKWMLRTLEILLVTEGRCSCAHFARTAEHAKLTDTNGSLIILSVQTWKQTKETKLLRFPLLQLRMMIKKTKTKQQNN
jgi:hypothetical protein